MSFKKKIKEFLKDTSQIYLRNFPGNFEVDKKNNLTPNQLYPYGKNIKKYFLNEAKINLDGLNLNENDKISSMGTCFAEEVSTYLKFSKENFNYISLENNIFNFSSNWGRVYTVKNLRQIIEYSLGHLPIITEKYNHTFFDPLREYTVGSFDSKNSLMLNIKKHRSISKRILCETNLLIVTLGQNEFWYDNVNKIAWGRTPPLKFRENVKRFIPFEYSFKENLDDLNYFIRLLNKFNPNIKIIFTVSPVPQHATFLAENILTSAFKAKSILRSVLSEIIPTNKNCYYFPSYEMVMAENYNSFNADNRHIKRKKVSEIMSIIGKLL